MNAATQRRRAKRETLRAAAATDDAIRSLETRYASGQIGIDQFEVRIEAELRGLVDKTSQTRQVSK